MATEIRLTRDARFTPRPMAGDPPGGYRAPAAAPTIDYHLLTTAKDGAGLRAALGYGRGIKTGNA